MENVVNLHRGILKMSFVSRFLIVFATAAVANLWAQQPAAPANPAGGQAPAGTTQRQATSEPPISAPADPAAGMKKSSLPPDFDAKTGLPLYETIQEDWSSLQIGVSKLDPQPPLVAETDVQDGFTRTLVQLQWRPGDPLDFWDVIRAR